MPKKGGIIEWMGLAALMLALAGCASTGEQDPEGGPAEGAEAAEEAESEEGAAGAEAQGLEGDTVEDGEALEAEERGAEEEEASKPDQKRVFFAFDSSELDDEAREVLREHAKYLKANGDIEVALEGHTDERGSRDYNLALGERRAESVKRLLVVQGVSSDRLEVNSFGEERPMAEGSDEDAYAKNRRVRLRYDQ
ncbi:MAG: peptidoglycan-associated lipoprotein Pal [Thiohalospira sp.]|uniref:peptidoglycan-associated lipoprotein Pal n=1 Tax=Thiohalorhabdus sp. TaxID=3094134 RepID=UPI003980D264